MDVEDTMQTYDDFFFALCENSSISFWSPPINTLFGFCDANNALIDYF